MPEPFSYATAEQVMAAVDAVAATQAAIAVEIVAEFADLTKDQATRALELSVQLGLLRSTVQGYETASPLARFAATPGQAQKASVLRIVLESFKPFRIFRQRLSATGSPGDAAQQTKALLALDAHREEIKDTLISLGTYSQALVVEGGGRYAVDPSPPAGYLAEVAKRGGELAAAEQYVRQRVGSDIVGLQNSDEVFKNLADAFVCASGGDGRGAVVRGGNAVETYLVLLAGKLAVAKVDTAPGVNAKLDLFRGRLPGKSIAVGKYLGNLRNAADHGSDSELNGASWSISDQAAIEFVNVSCTFVASTAAFGWRGVGVF